ncbi:MerR family transcriptional regulator [Mycobacterium sp. 852013-50091_SCH5140682]|uniref:MerR family transcriptional regulator n=1 Tax=Mycobacterium sp. 852013-50091_SCH5140682 TaxID=1834109 RepID=UPI001E4DC3A7|nr:MerR family transcriptional regulator [Mycobacterium sp. 852013-50091_SCH5140682]
MTEYRLDDLARISGISARNIRAYRERGLLDPPRRVGRSAYYGEAHLAQLAAISQLLGKGFSSAHIAEFFDGLRGGRSLVDVLGIPPTAVGQQVRRLRIAPANPDVGTLVSHGLARIVDGAVALTDPVLAEVVDQVADQQLWVHTIAQVTTATDAAIDALAESAVATVAENLTAQPEADSRELARAVLSSLLDQAVKQAAAIA